MGPLANRIAPISTPALHGRSRGTTPVSLHAIPMASYTEDTQSTIKSEIVCKNQRGEETVDYRHVMGNIMCMWDDRVDLLQLLRELPLVPEPVYPAALPRNARREKKQAVEKERASLSSAYHKETKRLVKLYDKASQDEGFGYGIAAVESHYYSVPKPRRRIVPLAELRSFLLAHADTDVTRAAINAYDFDALASRVRDHWLARVRDELVPIENRKRRLEELIEDTEDAVEQREWKRPRLEEPVGDKDAPLAV